MYSQIKNTEWNDKSEIFLGKSGTSLNNTVDLRDYFNKNKRRLYYDCRDSRVYSFCQKHYIISFNHNNNEWHPFRPVNRIYFPKIYIL